MSDTIVCPHCKKQFAASQAFSHQLDEERLKIRREEGEVLRKKIEEEMQLKLKDSRNELDEVRKQNQQLQEQLLETNKLLRQMRQELSDKNLEMQKKLAQEEEKIRQEAKRQAQEEEKLARMELEKKLKEVASANEVLKQKLEQGSQQTQGEVLEEYLEQLLRQSFVNDIVEPVAKGIRGADVIQTVRNNFGKAAGKIIWESKRTKAWSNEWTPKLKADMRSVNADYAVLVTNTMPSDIKNFGHLNGIWVTNYESIIGIATALRIMLISVASVKSSTLHTNDKKEALYEYVRSIEFKHKVEAIAEAFTSRLQDLEVEKRWFMKKWAKEEKSIRSIISNNDAMYADLQHILGKELTELKGLVTVVESQEIIAEDRLL